MPALSRLIQLGNTLQSKDALIKTHHDCLNLQAKLSERYVIFMSMPKNVALRGCSPRLHHRRFKIACTKLGICRCAALTLRQAIRLWRQAIRCGLPRHLRPTLNLLRPSFPGSHTHTSVHAGRNGIQTYTRNRWRTVQLQYWVLVHRKVACL